MSTPFLYESYDSNDMPTQSMNDASSVLAWYATREEAQVWLDDFLKTVAYPQRSWGGIPPKK